MATWKKLIVSGSVAELASVSASVGVLVGTNQQIQPTQANTRLTGSFTGSFTGDGSNLTGVTATPTFPTTALTDITNSTNTKFFINDDAGNATSGNKQITWGNLLTDLAGSGISVEGTDSLSVNSGSLQTFFNSSSYAGVSGDILINASSGVATIQANSVALGTDTTGNYVATVSGSGAIVSSVTTGEGSTPEITLNTSSTTFTSGVVAALPAGTVSGSSLTTGGQGSVTLTTNGVAQVVDLGLETGDSPQFVNLTLTGDITVGGQDIKSNGGTTVFTLDNANATVAGNLTVSGDLTVTGNVSEMQITNLNVEDQFALFASGSGTTDAGFIAASGSISSGSALYHDITDNRWAVAKSVASNATAVTPLEYVTTVKLDTGTPSTQEYGRGEMYINTTDESIWIYS
jgi:hypothetical protein